MITAITSKSKIALNILPDFNSHHINIKIKPASTISKTIIKILYEKVYENRLNWLDYVYNTE